MALSTKFCQGGRGDWIKRNRGGTRTHTEIREGGDGKKKG